MTAADRPHGNAGDGRQLVEAADHAPRRLPDLLRTSGLLSQDRAGELLAWIPLALEKVLRHHDRATAEGVLGDLTELLTRVHGAWIVDGVMKRLQVVLGHRRMSVGIYDHAFHVVGGGQKYVATLAAALQDRFDVTYLVHRDVNVAQLRDWYELDLSRCKVRVVPLPFFGGRQWIDSGIATGEIDNPFDPVARASADYDVFVNANMLEKVRPLAPLSLFMCHFPDAFPRAHFAAHEYTLLVANSKYTSGWVRRRWGLEPSILLYPPIDAAGPQVPKERFILSVARFEPGGSKKQREMVEAFLALRRALPERLQGWRLVLVGGSLERNAYLERVRDAVRGEAGCIDLRVNVSLRELRTWYARASIFWHACGLGERDPQLIEHFGMTTVEAMQNRCAPVVFDGGGQREIVEHGVNGFRFRGLDELCAFTARLIGDEPLCTSIQREAQRRSERFSRAAFEGRARTLFDLLHREYSTLTPPDFREAEPAVAVDCVSSST
jgi:glycosyltransferase involved in cell wall biosynthesis